jgi:hypothetical protein
VVNDTARQDDRLASLLDRAMVVGPYGKLASLALMIGAQMAANHKMIEPSPGLGILDEQGLQEALDRSMAGRG